VVVNLGGKKPLVVLDTSNLADPSGVVVPIPTWAKVAIEKNNNDATIIIFITYMINEFWPSMYVKSAGMQIQTILTAIPRQ
jgi:hypothetical protein